MSKQKIEFKNFIKSLVSKKDKAAFCTGGENITGSIEIHIVNGEVRSGKVTSSYNPGKDKN